MGFFLFTVLWVICYIILCFLRHYFAAHPTTATLFSVVTRVSRSRRTRKFAQDSTVRAEYLVRAGLDGSRRTRRFAQVSTVRAGLGGSRNTRRFAQDSTVLADRTRRFAQDSTLLAATAPHSFVARLDQFIRKTNRDDFEFNPLRTQLDFCGRGGETISKLVGNGLFRKLSKKTYDLVIFEIGTCDIDNVSADAPQLALTYFG